MKPIVVFPFASELHGKEYYLNLFEIIKKKFTPYGIEIYSEVITNETSALEALKTYKDFIPIAIALTGGTSRLIHTFVEHGNIERLFIFAHPEHNSLASAVSARARCERDGVLVGLYYCSSIYDSSCDYSIWRLITVARTVSNIVGSKVGVVSEEADTEIEEAAKDRLAWEIEHISFTELQQVIDRIDDTRIQEFMEKIDSIKIEGAREPLRAIGKLYFALKDIAKSHNLNYIAIDCFPFILKYGYSPCIALALLNAEGIVVACEADISALIGMIIARSVSGMSGWISNIVNVFGNNGIFAHCTIAMDIAKELIALNHFESGKPYGLTGKFIGNTATLISIDRDLTLMTVTRGKVKASGSLGYPACRTQALVEFDYIAEEIPRLAPTNHHVFIMGDYIDIVKDVGYMLGLDVIDYKGLV
ncbi:conserved hypothetical protein [Ignisphaera aggregans DSM 17230]|uniref:Fucose isomerase n=1 Tax=Ignisphaera aggregans (strain DSM 17230 / JCM 13409 / AQ1.S1) TaxID=583356 RepID=E0SQJ4_IGNAA|nr:conserved hypothetical protein [Ignisphaera aggregans DSM 17230]